VAEELRIDERLSIPLAEIELRASRSSGPGGQHANVTASRVEAVFDVEASAALGEAQRARLRERAGPIVVAVAQDARGQARNRELALERLAAKIAAARERRLEGKRRTAERKRGRRRPPPDAG
jgi:ribosome-associated protein